VFPPTYGLAASNEMLRGSARAAARTLTFWFSIVLIGAAPSEASRNFTRDQAASAKKFYGALIPLQGGQAVDSSERAACLLRRKSTVSQARDVVVSLPVPLSQTFRWRLGVVPSISFPPVCSRRALPSSRRTGCRPWQWCVCYA